MRRLAGGLVALIILAVGAAGVWIHDRLTSLESEAVTPDVYAIFGLGGNVGVLATAEGAVVVDSMSFRLQGERIRGLAERLGGGPVQLLFNTHYHRDHTHGNPGFVPGMRVIATQRTLDYLRAFDASYWDGAREQTLPDELVTDEIELRIGGKTVRALHPGPGHTGGDLVVLFVEDRVAHLGDLLFAGRYPRVDHAAGGSLRGWIESLDRVLELDFEHAIPGHGPVTDRAGVRAFQRFLREVQQLGEAAAAEGLSLEETLDRAFLREDAGYEDGGFPPLVSIGREDVVRQAWEEATGSVTAAAVPAAQRRPAP